MITIGEIVLLPIEISLRGMFRFFFAFMMPMSTGANMMVFGTGENFSLKSAYYFVFNLISSIVGTPVSTFMFYLLLNPEQYGRPIKLEGNYPCLKNFS